jgi:hypothetical protein
MLATGEERPLGRSRSGEKSTTMTDLREADYELDGTA